MSDLISSPLFYPIWWLIVSWLIWLLLKLTTLSRPALSTMLLYSVSIGIEYVKAFRELAACMVFELCIPTFSLFRFLADIAIWFIILYVIMILIEKIDRVEKPATETPIQL